MVAISLYRGNLHRVPPDVPRRWLMPTPTISFKDFRSLLVRRSKALSLLYSSSSSAPPNPKQVIYSPPQIQPVTEPKPVVNPNLTVVVSEKAEDVVDCQPLDRIAAVGNGGGEKEKEKEKVKVKVSGGVLDNVVAAPEVNDKLDEEKKKRMKEVEERLQVLNEKKHGLVQALKQILNAEEELKRRSIVQANRPPLPLQVDVSNDSGSMTRHATPRTVSDGNVAVDMEVGEADDALNHNPQPRQLLRMSSTSPSAESALRRTPHFHHTTATHPSRVAMMAAGSPSRFAPLGNQLQPTSLPTVSVTGTNYIASSPSPAASGGTSGFRDARHPSPWN